MRDTTFRQRLAALRAEHAEGARQLAAIDARRARLVETVLRLEGAVAVLAELEPVYGAAHPDDDPPPASSRPANGAVAPGPA
jgi:hypothetical protein